MMFVLINDQIKKQNEVHIHFEDRGYQFGDGIYEVVRIYNGQPFLMDEHIQRLARSAQELKMSLPLTSEQLQQKIEELLTRERCETGNVYIQVTRGVAPRTHQFPNDAQPVLTCYVIPAERPQEILNNGIKAVTCEDIRWLRCDIKSLNLLGNVLAKQTAVERNCQEAIQHRGEIVTEGSSTNVFIVKNGHLKTHPANNYILHGITRAAVIQLADRRNINVDETPFTLTDLFKADEVFVTGTTTEVCPVTHIDERPIANGTPGEVTRLLQQDFEELISQ